MYGVCLKMLMIFTSDSYTNNIATNEAKHSSVKRVMYLTNADASVATSMNIMNAVHALIQNRNDK